MWRRLRRWGKDVGQRHPLAHGSVREAAPITACTCPKGCSVSSTPAFLLGPIVGCSSSAGANLAQLPPATECHCIGKIAAHGVMGGHCKTGTGANKKSIRSDWKASTDCDIFSKKKIRPALAATDTSTAPTTADLLLTTTTEPSTMVDQRHPPAVIDQRPPATTSP